MSATTSTRIIISPELGRELSELQEAFNIEDDQDIKDKLSAHILQVQHELLNPVTLTEEIAIKMQHHGFLPGTDVQNRRDLDATLLKRHNTMNEAAIASGKPDPRIERPKGFRVHLKEGIPLEIMLSKLGTASWHVPSKKKKGQIDLVGCDWKDFRTSIITDFDIVSIEEIR